MTSKPKPTRCKPAFRLPTVAAFAKLPLSKRTNLFARWLARQPKTKTYDYHDVETCVVTQFGNALYRTRGGEAGGWSYWPPGEWDEGVVMFDGDNWGTPRQNALAAALRDHTTFGAASRAFQAALKG